MSVQSVTSISTTQNLHNQDTTCDLIIIAPSDFFSAAYQLQSHRAQPPDSIKSIVVDIQDIYKEFSGGLQDPTGIRNFYTMHIIIGTRSTCSCWEMVITTIGTLQVLQRTGLFRMRPKNQSIK